VRIAVSGTHCSGKSTLVEDFLAIHPEYEHEPEPYEWLVEMYGEGFAEHPSAADFYRQLELSVERLLAYPPGSRMIAERSPLDFLAYLRALEDSRSGDVTTELFEAASEAAARGMKHLDLLVVLPLDAADGIVAPPSEDLELRDAMNDHLLEIINGSDGGDLRVIEVRGTARRRLAALERAIV
jgi:hypothetical protein